MKKNINKFIMNQLATFTPTFKTKLIYKKSIREEVKS
ncbi:Uncharacterised protein [Serratia quinivorans]|uniref:Uncharacterized protein n=1 Tax=Serratia quinivorans TaxID=137545 RepID=A0A380AYR9_9GAMM|nr:Uncharacterised protein [Serratia quinivorans]